MSDAPSSLDMINKLNMAEIATKCPEIAFYIEVLFPLLAQHVVRWWAWGDAGIAAIEVVGMIGSESFVAHIFVTHGSATPDGQFIKVRAVMQDGGDPPAAQKWLAETLQRANREVQQRPISACSPATKGTVWQ